MPWARRTDAWGKGFPQAWAGTAGGQIQGQAPRLALPGLWGSVEGTSALRRYPPSPMPEFEDLPPQQESADSPPSPQRKRRGCLVFGLLLPLLLLLLALWGLNGPGFRTLARLAGLKWATSQGLAGDFRVTGTIWSGIGLEAVEFSADGQGTLVKLSDLQLNYRPLDVLKSPGRLNWLDGFRVGQAEIRIFLPEADPAKGASPAGEVKRKEGKSSSREGKEPPLWQLLAADLTIEDLTLEVHRGDKLWSVESLRLDWPGKAGQGSLKIARLSLPGYEAIEGIEASLRQEAQTLTLGPVRLFGDSEIEFLSVEAPSPGTFAFRAGLALAGGKLDFALQGGADEALQASLDLRRGTSLDLSRLPLRENPWRGSITGLSWQFQGHPQRVQDWRLDGKLVASRLGQGKAEIDTLLLLGQGDRLDAEAKGAGFELHAGLHLPFAKIDSPAAWAEHPLSLELDAEIRDLAEALPAFGLSLPLAGVARVQARDWHWVQGQLVSGGMEMATQNLSWQGVAVPVATLRAEVSGENFVSLEAKLGLDEDNHAHLAAGVDLRARRYQGQANAQLDTGAARGRPDLFPDRLSGAARVEWTGQGRFDGKNSSGDLRLALNDLCFTGGRPFGGEAQVNYQTGAVFLKTFSLEAEGWNLQGRGEWDGRRLQLSDWRLRQGDREAARLALSLPCQVNAPGTFLEQSDALSLLLEFDDLALEETARVFLSAPPVLGRLQGQIQAEGRFAALALTGKLQLETEGGGAGETSEASTLDISLQGDLAKPASWVLSMEALLSQLPWMGSRLEMLRLQARTDTSRTDRPLLAELHWDQEGAVLEAQGRVDLHRAAGLRDLRGLPCRVDATLEIDELASFLEQVKVLKGEQTLPIRGGIRATLEGLSLRNGGIEAGQLRLQGGELSVEGQNVEGATVEAHVSQENEIEARIQLGLDSANRLDARLHYHLHKRHYEGEMDLQADLRRPGSRLQGLLQGRKLASLLPATAAAQWKGEGKVDEASHSGEFSLKTEALQLAAGAEPIDFLISGSYAPEVVDVSSWQLRSAPLQLTGVLSWRDDHLSLSGQGQSAGEGKLAIEASLPLSGERFQMADWFAQETPMDVKVSGQSLALGTLSRLWSPTPRLLGDLSLDLDFHGSPAKPELAMSVDLSGLRVPREKGDFPAGQLSLKAKSEAAQLELTGEYRHPDVEPLLLTAALPFHPGAWATGARSFAEEPVEAQAGMGRSDLGFLAGQVPGIESISGELTLDARVSGPLRSPQLQGEVDVTLPRLRLENRNAPSVQDLVLRARFAQDRVVLDRFEAILAGGKVSAAGETQLREGEAQVDVSITGSEVLLVRTPEANVRADLQLALQGPWSKARLSGEVGLTNSRFSKHFDLLPIGLPGRRTESVLPTVERSPQGGGAAYRDLDFGVKLAPFQDWPLALRIHSKDPFRVLSNLAESSITADLRLGGTLGRPLPVGRVEIEKGEMRLPFSRIDVETGRIEFDESTGFNGAIEFKARGRADRYQLAIYLHGRVLSPQHVLTSIPPLPSEDILTLIATGTTRDELLGSDAESLAAGKAAGLLLQKLREKSHEADADPTLLDFLEERTELELGRVNQETGEQTFGGRIRLWKQLFFVGDVDQQSDYRALLKYVFRFE